MERTSWATLPGTAATAGPQEALLHGGFFWNPVQGFSSPKMRKCIINTSANAKMNGNAIIKYFIMNTGFKNKLKRDFGIEVKMLTESGFKHRTAWKRVSPLLQTQA